MTATRRFYPHYFLQMLPPLCLIAAYVVQEAARSTAPGQEHRAIATLPCVLLLAMAVIAPVKRSVTEAASVLRSGGISMRADETIEVADYLERRVAPSDAFYVANYEAILYYLVPARRPTRYLFPPFLTSAHFAKVAGIDALDELRRIMSVVQPTFVVARATSMDREFDRALSRYLARDYALAVVIRDIRIYRRRTAT